MLLVKKVLNHVDLDELELPFSNQNIFHLVHNVTESLGFVRCTSDYIDGCKPSLLGKLRRKSPPAWENTYFVSPNQFTKRLVSRITHPDIPAVLCVTLTLVLHMNMVGGAAGLADWMLSKGIDMLDDGELDSLFKEREDVFRGELQRILADKPLGDLLSGTLALDIDGLGKSLPDWLGVKQVQSIVAQAEEPSNAPAAPAVKENGDDIQAYARGLQENLRKMALKKDAELNEARMKTDLQRKKQEQLQAQQDEAHQFRLEQQRKADKQKVELLQEALGMTPEEARKFLVHQKRKLMESLERSSLTTLSSEEREGLTCQINAIKGMFCRPEALSLIDIVGMPGDFNGSLEYFKPLALAKFMEKAKRSDIPRVALSCSAVTESSRTSICSVPAKSIAVGERLALTLASEREGYLTLLNFGTNGEVTVVVPNTFDPSARIGIETCVLPCVENRFLPRAELIKLGLEFVENGPAGSEQFIAIVSQLPLIDRTMLLRTSCDDLFLALTEKAYLSVMRTLELMPERDWSVGYLSFLVE